jgi:hypothetical protein
MDIRPVALMIARQRIAEQRTSLEDRLSSLVQNHTLTATHLEALARELRALEEQSEALELESHGFAERRAPGRPGRRQGDDWA